MTTPTREQVVQWAKEATDNQPLYGWKEFTFSANELQKLATLARADLEAQLAESRAEIAALKEDAERFSLPTDEELLPIVQGVVSATERPIGMVAYGLVVAYAVRDKISAAIDKAREEK